MILVSFFSSEDALSDEAMQHFGLQSTVEPRYKEVGYNKTLLKQGHFAGPSSLYFCFFTPI